MQGAVRPSVPAVLVCRRAVTLRYAVGVVTSGALVFRLLGRGQPLVCGELLLRDLDYTVIAEPT